MLVFVLFVISFILYESDFRNIKNRPFVCKCMKKNLFLQTKGRLSFSFLGLSIEFFTLHSSLFTLHSSLPPLQLLQFFAKPLPVEHTCEGEAEGEGEPDAKDAKVGNEAKDIA